jgi:hypothetical protein
MDIIIHIGTHKTGTSSIQNFCASNIKNLQQDGVAYPLGTIGARNVNFIGSWLAKGNFNSVEMFLNSAVHKAEVSGCKTLLLSAESFYAMTTFFFFFSGKPVDDYWINEKNIISTLSSILKKHDVKIHCFLRRQDKFYESLYNQMVKQAAGYSSSIRDFIHEAKELGDYASHLDLWERAFGKENIVLHGFDDRQSELVQYFFRYCLNINQVDHYLPPGTPVNVRLDNDAIAFKRIINKLEIPIAEKYVVSREFARISRDMRSDRKKEETLLSYVERIKLIKKYIQGNRLLSRYQHVGCRLDLFEVPIKENRVMPVWDGLDVNRTFEMLFRYETAMKRMPIKTEILLRTLINKCLTNYPKLEYLLNGVRRIINRRRVNLERQGYF